MTDNWYDTAQICVSGHLINSMSVSRPVNNKRFCDTCGKQTITTCQNCSSPIRGVFHTGSSSPPPNYSPPGFCHNCGSPFPWKK